MRPMISNWGSGADAACGCSGKLFVTVAGTTCSNTILGDECYENLSRWRGRYSAR